MTRNKVQKNSQLSDELLNYRYEKPIFFNSKEFKKNYGVGIMGVPISSSELTLGVEWFSSFLRKATHLYADWQRVGKEGVYSELITTPRPLVIAKNCTTCDLGDLNPEGQTVKWCLDKLSETWKQIGKAQGKPLFIGGDHSATYLILKALNNHSKKDLRDLTILHFDAHNDYLNQTDINLSHASPIFNLVNELNCKEVISFGVRTLVDSRVMSNGLKKEYLQKYLAKVKLVTPLEIRLLINTFISSSSAKNKKKKKKAYLTIDLDVLDAQEIPGMVNVPISGGLKWDELFLMIIKLRQEYDLIGCDVVEGSVFGIRDNATIKNLIFLLTLLVDVLSKDKCEYLSEN